LEKSRECFSLRNTHRTLVLAAPDGGPERPVWCQSVAQVCRAHRTLAPDTGRLLFERPVVRDISVCMRGLSDRRAPDAQGASGGLRPVTLQVCGALCARVRCATDASGVIQQSVRWCCVRHGRVVAVGGNGRVQTASDTWLTPEHRTLGVEPPVVPAVRPVPPTFAE